MQTFCAVQCDTTVGWREGYGFYLYNDELGVVLWESIAYARDYVSRDRLGHSPIAPFHEGLIARVRPLVCTIDDADGDGIADVIEKGGDPASLERSRQLLRSLQQAGAAASSD